MLFIMVRLIFTRHGQTIRNVSGVMQGQDHGDLNDKGIELVKKLSERLRNEKIDLIFSSDSLRCKILAEELEKFKSLNIEYTDLLREKENGDWVGKKGSDVDWDSLDGTFGSRKVQNGENLIEVRERARKFINFVLDKYGDTQKTILIISHGAFLKVLIGDLMGMDLRSSIFKLFIDHCSLTLVEFSDKYMEKYQLKYLNETEFLGDSRNWIEKI